MQTSSIDLTNRISRAVYSFIYLFRYLLDAFFITYLTEMWCLNIIKS